MLFACIAMFMFSCTKFSAGPAEVSVDAGDKSGAMVNAAPPPGNVYIDSFDAVNHDGDTTERMTIVGNQLNNPYLIPNMQQAYANLGITNVSVTVTNKYIRFKPTIDQLSYLDSFMDAKGLELFDAPLDYQILMEGDYYQDPSITAEQPTWQYAVVPNLFSFPSGVQYEVLAQIHIPGDNYTAVETEAERLAVLGGGGAAASTNGGVQPDGLNCPSGYHKDRETGHCVPNNCPEGYHWDNDEYDCLPDHTEPNPPPAPDAAVPAGTITVDETQHLAGLPASTTPGHTTDWYRAPLRQARVVARRWFKIERTYTDNAGHFQFTKRFKHKVKINVKFKNGDAVVRCLRGVRVWNAFSPLNKVIGVYDGNKSTISYNLAKYPDRHAKGNQYWVGGTVHNGVQEYKDFAATEHIGLPPTKLYVLITNWSSSSVTPMLHKRWASYLPSESVQAFFANYPASIVGGLTAVTNVVTRQIDVSIGYQIDAGNSFDIRHSDDVKETVYHELTHAAHYNALGTSWYTNFVNAVWSATITSPFSTAQSPYGGGGASYSPIIALGESWAYHMGNAMADLRYGTVASCQLTQDHGIFYGNGCSLGSGHPHLDALEFFNPNLSADPFHWIPKGLYQDLRDANNETNPVADIVSGYYTNQRMFTAFSSSITTLQGYRTNLLSQNSNTQATQVTSLFNQYHY